MKVAYLTLTILITLAISLMSCFSDTNIQVNDDLLPDTLFDDIPSIMVEEDF